MEWAARAIGVFYAVAGLLALRQMAIGWRMELLVGRYFPGAPVERAADIVLTLGAMLVLASGVALACLHSLAVPAFVACWTVQAGYLLWAQRWSPPEPGLMAGLRRQTLDAFAVYTVATATVMAFDHMKVFG